MRSSRSTDSLRRPGGEYDRESHVVVAHVFFKLFHQGRALGRQLVENDRVKPLAAAHRVQLRPGRLIVAVDDEHLPADRSLFRRASAVQPRRHNHAKKANYNGAAECWRT